MERPTPPFLARPSLDSINERELDLLLLQGLVTSAALRGFFLDKAAGKQEMGFVGAWRSVSNYMGETDILLLSDIEDFGRTALLIEDKIDAPFQDDQSGRYRSRGEAEIADGAWDKFFTCLCAPELFLSPYLNSSDWDMFISLEDIVSVLNLWGSDPNAPFLSDALGRAVGKYEKGGFLRTRGLQHFGANTKSYAVRIF